MKSAISTQIFLRYYSCSDWVTHCARCGWWPGWWCQPHIMCGRPERGGWAAWLRCQWTRHTCSGERAELSWLAQTCRAKYRPRVESWAQMGCWVYSESPAPGYWHLTLVGSAVCNCSATNVQLQSDVQLLCLATPFMDVRI